MTGVAVGSILGTTAVGLMPNPTGSAAITGLQSNYASGINSISSTLPIMGKVKGSTMVLGSVGGLMKSSSKIFKRRKR